MQIKDFTILGNLTKDQLEDAFSLAIPRWSMFKHKQEKINNRVPDDITDQNCYDKLIHFLRGPGQYNTDSFKYIVALEVLEVGRYPCPLEFGSGHFLECFECMVIFHKNKQGSGLHDVLLDPVLSFGEKRSFLGIYNPKLYPNTINALNTDGKTPLQALLCSNMDVDDKVSLGIELIEHGADVSATDASGNSWLHYLLVGDMSIDEKLAFIDRPSRSFCCLSKKVCVALLAVENKSDETAIQALEKAQMKHSDKLNLVEMMSHYYKTPEAAQDLRRIRTNLLLDKYVKSPPINPKAAVSALISRFKYGLFNTSSANDESNDIQLLELKGIEH